MLLTTKAGFLPEASKDIIIVILIIAVVFLLALQTFLLVKYFKLSSKYERFMKGSDGETLEDTILKRFEEIDVLKSETDFLTSKLNIACESLLTAYQKIGIIKYDAFKEMGGKLSFSLCMLDDVNNGFILTAMHTRDGCYTYIKEIIKGESFVRLAEEERSALDEAKRGRNFLPD